MNGGGRLKKLEKKVRSKSMELLVLAVFFLLSLRILNWFEYPYILISGDFRPPLVHEAFVKHVLYAWNEIDFGVPSVYSPRIIDPFYLFMTGFQTVGVSLYASQVITVFLMYFLSSMLMYIFVKQLTNGNITASFVAALYSTSNVYLINDREVTAIGFIDVTLMILPCLITFVMGIKTRSYKLMAVSGILCALSYATFPNYRTTLICLIMLCLVSLFFYIGKGLQVSLYKGGIPLNTTLPYRSLKLLAMFGIAFLLTSVWVAAITFSNFDVLTETYAEISTPQFIGGLKMYDVTRLIARWSFNSSALGKPYIPYKDMYLNNPLIIFSCYLPAILAFTSLLLLKKHKITIFFGSIAIVSLFLTSGFSFSKYGSSLYYDLMGLPLLRVFREASNWIFFVIISFSILIGCTVSALCHRFKNKISRVLVVSLIATLLLSTSYPLMTGDIARNWLKPDIKGSYLPPSYAELNNLLSSEYWTILLPQRYAYTLYNFTDVPFGCGNPYPLIFSKPIISGAGTEYLQSGNRELINKLHEQLRTNITLNGFPKLLGMLGIKYLIVEKKIVYGNTYSIKELKLGENENFTMVRDWEEVALFEDAYALKKFYIADTILNFSTLNDMYGLIENSEWGTLQQSVFINTALPNKTLVPPKNFVWKEISPTRYEANVESKGSFILVFLESYDEHWKVYVNGNPVPETNHQEVNAFANGWLIDATGNLTITIQYETQNLLAMSVVASVVLPILLLIFLSRRDIKRVASLIQCGYKRKIDQNKKESAHAK